VSVQGVDSLDQRHDLGRDGAQIGAGAPTCCSRPAEACSIALVNER